MKGISSQLIANILFSSSIYLLIGVSFFIVFYLTRIFHIFHAAMITTGAYLTYLFFIRCHLSFEVAIILSLLFTVIIGLIAEKSVYQPLRKRNAPPLSFLIASIGMYIVLQNIISIYFGDGTKVIVAGNGMPGYAILGARVTGIQLLSTGICIFLFISVQIFLRSAKYGRLIRAVACNPVLSKTYGINASRVIFVGIGISTLLAGVVGILLSMDTSMTPTFGFNILIYGVAAMMIGGLGSTTGLILGALVLSITQHLVAYYTDPRWMDATAYSILILFLLWKPLGFSGNKIKKIEI